MGASWIPKSISTTQTSLTYASCNQTPENSVHVVGFPPIPLPWNHSYPSPQFLLIPKSKSTLFPYLSFLNSLEHLTLMASFLEFSLNLSLHCFSFHLFHVPKIFSFIPSIFLHLTHGVIHFPPMISLTTPQLHIQPKPLSSDPRILVGDPRELQTNTPQIGLFIFLPSNCASPHPSQKEAQELFLSAPCSSLLTDSHPENLPLSSPQ